MKFSLREKATDDYKAFYGKYLDAVQNLNVEVYTEFNNELKKTKYDKLQREISEIMDNYNNTVVGDIENGTFSAWKESNSSLCACLKMYQAGDKANEVCIGIEKEMGNMMQENLKIVKEDPVNTAEPIISDEGLENLENKCVAAQTEIQNIKSQFVADLDSKIAENEIYGTLKPLFEDVAKKLEAFFSDSLKRFKDLHEFVNEKASQTNSKAEESVSRVSSGSETSQNAANGAGGISGGSGINNGVASSLAGGDSAMGDVEATGQEASADAGEEGEQEESANPSEEAEQETSVEPGEATEQESVVEPVEESEQEAAVEPIEATEQEESANPSEEAEQETSVEPGEATEQEVEAEPREATEQEAVVEPVEESEQEAAAEPTEEAEHETNVEPSETTEREVEAEPREATEQESVVEPVEE
jgi:hypothetical protein